MIEAKSILTIVAWDDAEADRVYAAINTALKAADLNAVWPRTPIVNIHEVERSLRVTTDIEERTHDAR